MARATGPRKVHRYTAEFKLKAVKLSELNGVQVQDVAEALDIHPFMLSRWRKEAREGRIKARTAVAPEARQQRDVTELARIKRQYALLQEEHELLKKADNTTCVGTAHDGVAGAAWIMLIRIGFRHRQREAYNVLVVEFVDTDGHVFSDEERAAVLAGFFRQACAKHSACRQYGNSSEFQYHRRHLPQREQLKAEHLAELDALATEQGIWVDGPANFAVDRQPATP